MTKVEMAKDIHVQFLKTTLYSRAKLRAEAISSIMTKVEMAKVIQLEMGKYFAILGGKFNWNKFTASS